MEMSHSYNSKNSQDVDKTRDIDNSQNNLLTDHSGGDEINENDKIELKVNKKRNR